MIRRLLQSVFFLSAAGMLWTAFFWPLVNDANGGDPVLRILVLVSLWGYLGSLAGLLLLRAKES